MLVTVLTLFRYVLISRYQVFQGVNITFWWSCSLLKLSEGTKLFGGYKSESLNFVFVPRLILLSHILLGFYVRSARLHSAKL